MAEPGLPAAGRGGTPDQPSRQPVARSERLISLDFIRGIAVLGILFANITAFGHPFLAYSWPEALPEGGNRADDLVWLFQLVFVDGKFRGLFTILFGAGLYLFMERACQRGATAWLQVERLIFLTLFGIAHFVFLFVGDILVLYAISGFVALTCLGWSARRQFLLGLGGYLLGSALFTLTLGSQAMLEQVPALRSQASDAWQQMEAAWEMQVADAARERAVMSGESYAEIIAFRLDEQAGQIAQLPYLALFETIPLLLVGMALYRFGLFSGKLDSAKLRRWGWAGVILGGLANLVLGWWILALDFPPYLTSFVFSGASTFARLPMILGLTVLLSLWAPRAAGGWLGARIVAAGRIAFSNYIGTSLLMVFVFHGWAGGLFGELHRAELLGIVAAAWAVMLAWSQPWLRSYRYGPLEWLWRCLTYGKLFAIRR